MLNDVANSVVSAEWEIPEQTYCAVMAVAQERQVDVSAIALAAINREVQVQEIINLRVEIATATPERLHNLRRRYCSALGAVWRAIELAPDPGQADSEELAEIWQSYQHQLSTRKVLCQRAISLLTEAIDRRDEQQACWTEQLEQQELTR